MAALFAEVPDTTVACVTRNLRATLNDLAVEVLFGGRRALADLLLEERDTPRSIFAQRLMVAANLDKEAGVVNGVCGRVLEASGTCEN